MISRRAKILKANLSDQEVATLFHKVKDLLENQKSSDNPEKEKPEGFDFLFETHQGLNESQEQKVKSPESPEVIPQFNPQNPPKVSPKTEGADSPQEAKPENKDDTEEKTPSMRFEDTDKKQGEDDEEIKKKSDELNDTDNIMNIRQAGLIGRITIRLAGGNKDDISDGGGKTKKDNYGTGSKLRVDLRDPNRDRFQTTEEKEQGEPKEPAERKD